MRQFVTYDRRRRVVGPIDTRIRRVETLDEIVIQLLDVESGGVQTTVWLDYDAALSFALRLLRELGSEYDGADEAARLLARKNLPAVARIFDAWGKHDAFVKAVGAGAAVSQFPAGGRKQ